METVDLDYSDEEQLMSISPTENQEEKIPITAQEGHQDFLKRQ